MVVCSTYKMTPRYIGFGQRRPKGECTIRTKPTLRDELAVLQLSTDDRILHCGEAVV